MNVFSLSNISFATIRGKPEELEKNKRRCDRLVEVMQAMKRWVPDDVTYSALMKTGTTNEVSCKFRIVFAVEVLQCHAFEPFQVFFIAKWDIEFEYSKVLWGCSDVLYLLRKIGNFQMVTSCCILILISLVYASCMQVYTSVCKLVRIYYLTLQPTVHELNLRPH